MSRKDFVAVARALRGARNGDCAESAVVDRAADELAAYFATRNPRFDRARFLAATKEEKN